MASLLGACFPGPLDADIVQVGAGRAEVRERLGAPDRSQEFRMPEIPFFGPQESLTGLIPAGTLVEEWVYIRGEEELYVWFTGPEGGEKDQWRVIGTGVYPLGAVY